MAGRTTMPPAAEEQNRLSLSVAAVNRLLDTLEKPLIVAERSGSLLLVNARARQCLENQGSKETEEPNLFSDFLKMDSRKIFCEIERGEHEVKVQIGPAEKKTVARIQWMPEPDWLVVEIENTVEAQTEADPTTQLTVQELLQEREIAWMNFPSAGRKHFSVRACGWMRTSTLQ